jgi:hypothetical protein
MWVNFKSSRPFAIKVYTGGVNAGKPMLSYKTFGSPIRRRASWNDKLFVLPAELTMTDLTLIVSGEPRVENLATLLRRTKLVEEGKSIQDYVVSGSQKWLGGIASADGKVMQFVSVAVSSSYSVEAQLTGQDSVAGLQFEVMPTKRKPMCVFVKQLAGKTLSFRPSFLRQFMVSRRWYRTVRVFHLISRDSFMPESN